METEITGSCGHFKSHTKRDATGGGCSRDFGNYLVRGGAK